MSAMRCDDQMTDRTGQMSIHKVNSVILFCIFLKVIRLIDWHFVCVWVSVLRIEDSILVLVVLHLLLCWSEGREKESSQNIQAHARMRTWARWFHLSSFSFLSLSFCLSFSSTIFAFVCLFVSFLFIIRRTWLETCCAAKQQQQQQRKRGKKIKK